MNKFEMEIFFCVFVFKIKIEIYVKLVDIWYVNCLFKFYKIRYNVLIKFVKIIVILFIV